MSKIISIKDSISPDLALRNTVSTLFKSLENDSEREIIIDFSGVISMSRSFAHEYLLNIERINTAKQVSEINIPQNIQQMFNIVKNSTVSKSFELDASKVITI